jgi:hypothetical protein
VPEQKNLFVPVAVAFVVVCLMFWRVIVFTALVLAALAALAVTAWVVLAVIRFARATPAARRNYPRSVLCRFRWRSITRNLGLAQVDQHARDRSGTARRRHVRHPRVRVRADEHGVTARVKTVPGTGRKEFEDVVQHLADAGRFQRVSVQQAKPGHLTVRGLVRDPLAEPLAAAALPPFDGRHITLGRDEQGAMRRVSLAGHAGSCWAGNPGRGKTESALSLAVQMVPSLLVDFWVLDGGACDWSHFAHGAAGYVDDDLQAAEDMLAGLDRKMRARRRNLEAELGVRNGWLRGPTEAYRLQWLLVEEAPFYLSLDAVKGDKKLEAHVLACRGFVAQLLRRGRAPMFHTSLLGQKITSTSIPPDLRDLCGLRWSFGTSTIEAAAACLGADIRQYAAVQPTMLQGDDYIGVATVLLPTGQSPYTLVKFPAVGEDLADKVALNLAAPVPSAVPVNLPASVSVP